MVTTFTPGPWRISTGCSRWIVQDKGGCIACVEQDREAQDANARLIAAAPELLEALQWAMSRMNTPTLIRGQNDAYVEAYNNALSAIAKATGEAQ